MTVNLLDANGVIIATTTTAADGTYIFENVPPGDYLVEVVPPADSEFTIPGGDSLFTDAITTISVTVVAGETVTDIDAGLIDEPVPAPDPLPAPDPAPPTLAFTGVESSLLALIGLALLAFGAMQLGLMSAITGRGNRRQ